MVQIVFGPKGDELEIKTLPSEVDSREIITKIKYIFWLDYPLEDLDCQFSNDKYLRKIFAEGKSLRIMRDLNKEYRILEAVLTQNTSVRMIKRMQKELFTHYGEKRKINGEEIHIYPKAKTIANVSESDLREKCKLGSRASYFKGIAQAIVDKKILIEELEKMSTEDAREFLMKFKGIGKKVADIILMYGFGRQDVFPLDLWVKRAIEREYFKAKQVTEKEVYEFARDYFGMHASLANLMIFYKERKQKKFFNINIWR